MIDLFMQMPIALQIIVALAVFFDALILIYYLGKAIGCIIFLIIYRNR